jgi:hypothetical protein
MLTKGRAHDCVEPSDIWLCQGKAGSAGKAALKFQDAGRFKTAAALPAKSSTVICSVVRAEGGGPAREPRQPTSVLSVTMSGLLLRLQVTVVIRRGATGERQPLGQRREEEREFDFHRVV